MKKFNTIYILGILGQDPQMMYYDTGNVIATLRVATHRKVGERQVTDWHEVVAWNNTAKAIQLYLRKGSRVFIEGSLSYKDGRPVITARSVQFLDGKPEVNPQNS